LFDRTSFRTKVTPMKLRLAPGCAVLLLAVAQAQSYAPKEGFVPDGRIAAKIAEAVLIPAYGKEEVESGFAYQAIEEKKGVWTVGWSLGCPEAKAETCLGGKAEVKIRQADGRILKVIHHD
jgi:hypothetical protein